MPSTLLLCCAAANVEHSGQASGCEGKCEQTDTGNSPQSIKHHPGGQGFPAQRLTNMLSAMTISNGTSLQKPCGFPRDPAWSLRTTRRMTTWCEGASPYWTQSAS